MPWAIRKGGGNCAADKWAVVNKQTGKTMGCHDTKASATRQLAALNANTDESRSTPMTRKTLSEARNVVEATPVDGKPGRFKITLITPGWGSSGYYGPDVLEAAADAKVFPAGLHMYADHPAKSEEYDRPERSIEDIRAILSEDAVWDGQRLVAEARVLSTHRVALTEMSDDIGVSIRAIAETTHGEAEGRRGVIVDELIEAISADFVTHAGRGGRIEVLESALPDDVVKRAMRRAGIAEATANELREMLQDALREAYGGDKSWVWVRDFDSDESLVWYFHETPDESGTFQHSYESADGVVSLTGDPVEVRAETKYVPVTPAGDKTTESLGGTMPQIEEARLRELEEASGRVPTLESERDAAIRERDQALRQMAIEKARSAAVTHARARVVEANAELLPATVDRIVAEATRTVPLIQDGDRAGQLDEPALDAAVDTARTAEEAYLASLAEREGAGTVTGFGGAPPEQGGGIPDLDKAVAEAFRRDLPQTQEA